MNSGIFTVERGSGESATITGVTPQGPEPEVITEAFGGDHDENGADFTVLSVVTETIDEALRGAGYETFAALVDADTDDLTGLTSTFTESRAATIVQEAPQHVPVGTRLAVNTAQ